MIPSEESACNEVEETFVKHSSKDSALAPAKSFLVDDRTATFLGKVLIFLIFPTLVGMIGLYVGYLETSQEGAVRELSFDHDFGLPFALTLAICLVVGFQTGGFTMKEPKSLIAWPKVKSRKKWVHKYVVRGQTIHDSSTTKSVDSVKKVN